MMPIEAVMLADERRCSALTSGDAEALAALLDGDLVHVHANGMVHSKEQYLSHVARSPRRVERLDTKVVMRDHCALMTGRIRNHSGDSSMTIWAMQTWILAAGEWRLLSFCANLSS